MIIECPNCNKNFRIDKKFIPENGRTVKCSSCDHIWYYKTSKSKVIDNHGISGDKNTNLDTNISEKNKEEYEYNEGIDNRNLADINQVELSEENTENDKEKEVDKKNDNENEEKQGRIKMVLVYFVLVIISLLGLIFLLDTFKSYISEVYPDITPLFDSFYETLLDFKLFIKDLTN